MATIGETELYVAFLRGINVGGRRKLPMVELVSIFEQAGGKQVRTYIQSGNVIFEVEAEKLDHMRRAIGRSIAGRFGWETPVIARSAGELARIVRDNPFSRSGVDARMLHVALLASPPNASRIARLDPGRSTPDEFVVEGSEIYLSCPNGLARSRLTNAYFDSTLGTPSTLRNWNTMLKLRELTLGQ